MQPAMLAGSKVVVKGGTSTTASMGHLRGSRATRGRSVSEAAGRTKEMFADARQSAAACLGTANYRVFRSVSQ